MGTRLYDGAQLGNVYQADANGNRNVSMPTYNEPQKDPDWIFNAERRIVYQPRLRGDAIVAGPQMKVLGQTSINLLVNSQGEEYPVDSANDRFRVHTLDTVFTPKSGIDPEAPPPEIFTDFLIFESAPVMVANMSVSMTSQSLRLIEVPVIDQDQEGATVVLFSVDRTSFDVFHPLYLPCTQIQSPSEPFRCFTDCFITRQCPRDCDIWQFAHDHSFHTAPLGCSNSDSCRTALKGFQLSLTGANVTGKEPFAKLPTDELPVPPRFLPMLRPKMYSTRSVPHVGVRMCLTKGPRISNGDLIRNTTAGLFSFIVESFPSFVRSQWSTVNLRTFSPSSGFFDSIVNVSISTVNTAPTLVNASVSTVQKNTPTSLSLSTLTQAADADGDLFQFQIVEQPLHGQLFQYPSTGSEFDQASSAALALQYVSGRIASVLNDKLTSLPLESSELLLHPVGTTYPRAPVAHADVNFVEAYRKNYGFQNLVTNVTEDFASVVCGELGVYPVEFEYDQALFVSRIYLVGLSLARTRVTYRVLTKSHSVADALPHVSYRLGYRQRRTQDGSRPDIQSGSTSSSETLRTRAFKDSRYRDRRRQQLWTEVYRGVITQSAAFTSDLWGPPIAPSRERSRIVRVEFCGANGAGPGRSNGRDFSMESGLIAIVAGGLNDRSTAGSLVRDASHRVMYVPNDGFTGDDRFTVVLSDFTLTQMMVATVPLRVQPVNDPPIATTLEFFIKASDVTPLVIQLRGFDADTASASLSTFVTEAPAQGSLLQFTGEAISGTGVLVRVTDSQHRILFSGGGKAGTPLASFRYVANDGFFNSRTVTVTVHSMCGVGQRLEQSSLSCVSCSAGFVIPDAVHRHASCVACPPGSYQDKTGQGLCISCPKGFEAPESASAVCAPCNAGYFAAEVATVKCPPCGRGEFQPRKGQSQCLVCGSLAYSNTIGSTACNDCPPNSRSSSTIGLDKTLCQCIRGYFDPIGRSGVSCTPCPYGAYCEGQQFPPVPFAGFYTDRRLWSTSSQLSMNTLADELDIALQYFQDSAQQQKNSSSSYSDSSAAIGNASLSILPPAANATINSAPPSFSSTAELRRSLDQTISDMRPVFFACGLYGNPSACSGYPNTQPFFAAKMCRHRPVEGKCATSGELKLNYSSTSACASG